MALSGGGTITAIGARASPDGQHIFAACAATVRIYSALTSALLAELRGHTEDVTAIALDPNSPTKVLLFAKCSLHRSTDQQQLGCCMRRWLLKWGCYNTGVLCLS